MRERIIEKMFMIQNKSIYLLLFVTQASRSTSQRMALDSFKKLEQNS